MPCWCCRRRGARPAIAAEVGARRMAYVCSACAVSEELVRAFAAKQMAELQGQGLRFRRLPFIRRTVFAVVFADLEQTTEDGSVIATVPTGKAAPGGA
ncbi:MAG: hypothetical protein U0841_04625 [Chloroflexia bacterium]